MIRTEGLRTRCTDRGSVHLVALLVVLLGLSVLVGALGLGMGVRHHMQRAADLTALAAAGLHSTTPCADAARVAVAHDLTLASCTWQAGQAEVTATRWHPRLGPLTATARAGLHAP